jgi:pimeloyl-ACP methyl ester carboxylesterase
VFVHGLGSGPGTWANTAARLQSRLRLKAYLASLPSFETYERQAQLLQSSGAGALPGNPVAIGHSNGGIVSREWSRSRPLGGVVTLGTPHEGSLLVQRAADFFNFNYLLNDAIGVLRLLELEETELQWIYVALAIGNARMQGLTAETLIGLISTVGVGVAAPVLGEMVPGSVYLSGLNSTDNLARESADIYDRVGLVFVAHDYWRAGFAVGLFPDSRELAYAVMRDAIFGLEFFAEFIRLNYPVWSSAQAVRQTFLRLASEIRQLDPRWCWAVTGDPTCTISHDGIVSTESQFYPSATNFGYIGPAHLQQTAWSEEVLVSVLTSVLRITTRE